MVEDERTAAGQAPETENTMTRKRISVLVGAAVLALVGLSSGVALAGCSSPGQPAAAASAASASPAGSPSGPDYSWYQSMMSGYYGSGHGMMGGSSYGWMMSQAGYQWMTGGTGAPGWMRGQGLPAFMMGGAAETDPGTVMGTLFAGAPGPRVSPADAQRLGSQVPPGASIDRSAARSPSPPPA
jgi:hypothetical protein